jgi:hypothetical protein
MEQVKARLEHARQNSSFERYSIGYLLFDNRELLKETELDSIFEIHKMYYGKSTDSYEPILSGMWNVYYMSKNDTLKREFLYIAEQAINDTIIDYVQRNNISRLLINKVDLSLFNEKLRAEVIKNLQFTCQQEFFKENSNKVYMLDHNIILLAGALEMTEVKSRLQAIADSTDSKYEYAASIALCRMGDKKMLKEYFDELQSMKFRDIIHKRYEEIEFIKQPEAVDLLLKILYSEETEPAIKDYWPDEKLAYYAMEIIERISTNCPVKANGIFSNERDAALQKMRKWAKNNKIKINRDIW